MPQAIPLKTKEGESFLGFVSFFCKGCVLLGMCYVFVVVGIVLFAPWMVLWRRITIVY